MKFQVKIENKNVSGLQRWIKLMVAGRVFTITFMLVPHDLGQKILFFLPLHCHRQQLLCFNPTSVLFL